jgi:hypothetical protein
MHIASSSTDYDTLCVVALFPLQTGTHAPPQSGVIWNSLDLSMQLLHKSSRIIWKQYCTARPLWYPGQDAVVLHLLSDGTCVEGQGIC